MFRLVAGEDVDMVIVQRRSGNHEPMRMKCSGSNRGRSVAKETRVWLKIRHRLTTVDVEDLDAMLLCPTENVSLE